MSIHALLCYVALMHSTPGCPQQHLPGSNRSWGKPAYGLRSSIQVEKSSISSGDPLAVSLVIENVSEAPMRVETFVAFKIRSRSTSRNYWCPVDIEGDDNRALSDAGLVLASRSRLILGKGASIKAVMDLAKHGWELAVSAIWPARSLSAVVPVGKYTLRLDIEIVGGAAPQWVYSNDVDLTIEPGRREAARRQTEK